MSFTQSAARLGVRLERVHFGGELCDVGAYFVLYTKHGVNLIARIYGD